jgi:ABC-type branched-chain amino acid transport systems, ATPase component
MSNVLEISGVNLAFGGLKALDDVNLTVQQGTVHAIIGPNGAGKSTLLNTIIGKLAPDTGSILFDGQSMLVVKPHEINQKGIFSGVSDA